MASQILNIAHRGASAEFPENTLRAFAEALRQGAQMCELDVRRSADGALVVIHDDSVNRTTNGRGRVASMSLEELQKLDAGAWLRADCAGERIPTVDEVFELVNDRCGLNVELKAEAIEEAVIHIIHRWDAAATTQISSFDWRQLSRIREIAPELRVGLLTDKGAKRSVDAAAAMGAYAINPRFDLVDARLCEAAHQQGLQVYAWTVDEPAAMSAMMAAGVDGIMNNYPSRLRRLLES